MTTRITLALEQLLSATKGSSISSQTQISDPKSATLTIASQTVVAGNGTRLVVVTNSGIQDAFFSYGVTAEAGKGIVLAKGGDRFTFPLAAGVDLNGITAMGTTELSFLFFG